MKRVLLGKASTARGGSSVYGLWISKPGKDVETCEDEELLFDSNNKKYAQVLANGAFTGSTGNTSTSFDVIMPTGTVPFVYWIPVKSSGVYSNFNAGFSSYPTVSISAASGNVSTITISSVGIGETIIYVVTSLED